MVLGWTESSAEELGLEETTVPHLHEGNGSHRCAHQALFLEPSALEQGMQIPRFHNAHHGPEQKGALVVSRGSHSSETPNWPIAILEMRSC